jgi:large subunit ribosomal protein L24
MIVPKFLRESRPEDYPDPVLADTTDVPLESVALVTAIFDKVTGATTDMIVKDVYHRAIPDTADRRKTKWIRKIVGTNIEVPWPEKPDPEYKEHEDDTQRIDVEVRSYVPALLSPPMPSSVIDELRNKYSSFRDRHDEDYIAKKVAEQEEKDKLNKKGKEMRSPLKELHRKERQERKKKGKPMLTPEMLEKIGEVIAKSRGLTLENSPVPMAETT